MGTGSASRRFGPLRTLSVAVGLGVLAAVLLISPVEPPCPFKMLGLDGPMCGGTRMLRALLAGDPLLALDFNAFALLVLSPVALSLFVAAARFELGRTRRIWPAGRGGAACAYLLGAGLLLWTILRNIPVPPLTTLST
ncbi:Protein of unknown function [Actinopolyspora lacussalsi subsp. righensis]|uniref:DUF2752 domain-containing protein n=1 Tax=Actinopolyspora righensis TaxID=995060 RepID=A0A1I6YQN9_9ACTN|nr:Protein of unknown function [Actinopolyspora righensis]